VIGIILYLTISSPTYETVPSQQVQNGTYFDIYVRHNKLIAVDPFQTIQSPVYVFFLNKSSSLNPSDPSTPKLIFPVLLDLSDDNTTSVLKSTKFFDKGGGKYEASVTISHTNEKIGMIEERFVLQIIYYTSNSSGNINNTSSNSSGNINYTTTNIPLSYRIILKDFNPFIYLFMIVGGVATSLFVSEYSGGRTISSRRVVFWLVISVVTATVIFSQFKEQITTTSDLFTNFILAFGFGFGAQRILSEATAPREGDIERKPDDKKPVDKKPVDKGSGKTTYTSDGVPA
jgi:hypothetical protein